MSYSLPNGFALFIEFIGSKWKLILFYFQIEGKRKPLCRILVNINLSFNEHRFIYLYSTIIEQDIMRDTLWYRKK